MTLYGRLIRLITTPRGRSGPDPFRDALAHASRLPPGSIALLGPGQKPPLVMPAERTLAEVLADMQRRAAIGRRPAGLVVAPPDDPQA